MCSNCLNTIWNYDLSESCILEASFSNYFNARRKVDCLQIDALFKCIFLDFSELRIVFENNSLELFASVKRFGANYLNMVGNSYFFYIAFDVEIIVDFNIVL